MRRRTAKVAIFPERAAAESGKHHALFQTILENPSVADPRQVKISIYTYGNPTGKADLCGVEFSQKRNELPFRKMKNLLAQLKTEDWVIVLAGVTILALALLFPAGMPAMPKTLAGGDAWLEAGCMFAFLFVLTCLCMAVLGRPVKGIFGSLLAIFAVALAAQAVASVPLFKDLGLESVFFSVIFGLAVSNFFRVPAWLKPAIQSEFYIKIGIVCLGATILFGEILHSGVYALAQAFIVVFLVWYFAFWVSRRMKVDDEMATMLSSSVSICGVSAAIATCGVIKGDNKKLSYIISLVLVCAVPMMYVMPWLAKLVLPALLGDPKVVEEVAGAWMGGTIDTTGAVVASGALLGETAEQTAVIVKSSQNVLLGAGGFRHLALLVVPRPRGAGEAVGRRDLGSFPEIRRRVRRSLAPVQPLLRRRRRHSRRRGARHGEEFQQHAFQHRLRLHRVGNTFLGDLLQREPQRAVGLSLGADIQHRRHVHRGLPAVRRPETDVGLTVVGKNPPDTSTLRQPPRLHSLQSGRLPFRTQITASAAGRGIRTARRRRTARSRRPHTSPRR